MTSSQSDIKLSHPPLTVNLFHLHINTQWNKKTRATLTQTNICSSVWICVLTAHSLSRQVGCVSPLWPFDLPPHTHHAAKRNKRTFRGHVFSHCVIRSSIILNYFDRRNNHVWLIPSESRKTKAALQEDSCLKWNNCRQQEGTLFNKSERLFKEIKTLKLPAGIYFFTVKRIL